MNVTDRPLHSDRRSIERIDALGELIALAANHLPKSFTPSDSAGGLAAELLVVGMTTARGIECLASATASGPPDHTEASATLLRKLLEVFALLSWIRDRGSNPVVQALRVQLSDARLQLRAAREITEVSPAADGQLADLERWVKALESDLTSLGVEATGRENTFDILKKVHPDYATRWRFESSAAHAGAMARYLQRDGDMLGAPATSDRHANVVLVALVLLGQVVGRAFSVMAERTKDKQAQEVLLRGLEQLELLAERHQDAGLLTAGGDSS